RMTAASLLERLNDLSPVGSLPRALEELYDGGLAIPSPCLYVNFVTSVDGVVAVEERRNSGSVISGHNRADRFLMGLLRAFAAAALRRELPCGCEVVAPGGEERVDLRLALDALRQRGYRRILCEGGPNTFGELLRQRLVDELFLTVSPVLAGRDQGGDRLGLV